MSRTKAPRRPSQVVRVLVAIAGGAWGALAGATTFALLAIALGAPTGTGSGELIPGPGWNRFTAFLLGLPVGLVVGVWGALRVAQRWPWAVGVPLAVIGALAVVTSLLEPSQWDSTFFLFVVPTLPGIAFLLWRRRRRPPSGGTLRRGGGSPAG